RSLQGVDFTPEENSLIVADYSRGLFFIDLKSRQPRHISAPDTISMVGIDGMCFYHGGLIAIQNGTRPHRVVRIDLSKDFTAVTALKIVEANNPLFDEPTLGVLVKDMFYYIANSQWG